MAKPNVLIFGGLNTYTRTLAQYLAPLDGESLVSHVRIVDKYIINPPTTYLGADFPKVLKNPVVEYKQANLTVPSVVASMFDGPEGISYDYVFDLTGEVNPERPAMIQIKATCQIARSIGLEAAKHKVKAYVRLQLPFYDTPGTKVCEEKEDVSPAETIGIWWHETVRMLGDIEDLNLVVVRVGMGYGPYINYGEMPISMAIAACYGYLKQPMKVMWSPGKHPTNTVHAYDIAGGLWACAQWMAPLGRKEADKVAGETIHFHDDKQAAKEVKEVEGRPKEGKKIVAPLFNLVDDSNSTLASNTSTAATFFGTTAESFNFFANKLIELKNRDELMEEINEVHLSTWTEMITTSTPPVPNTPLSAYADRYTIDKRALGLSNAKIKKVVGYTLRYPKFDHETMGEVIRKWEEEGNWPKMK